MLVLSEPSLGGLVSQVDRNNIRLGFGTPILGSGDLFEVLNPFGTATAERETVGGCELASLVSAASSTRIGLVVIVIVVVTVHCEVRFSFGAIVAEHGRGQEGTL